MANMSNIEMKIRAYLAPLLITAFGFLFTSNLMEMKSDLKLLLAHDNAQIVQIETLKAEIQELKEKYRKLEQEIQNIQVIRGQLPVAIKTKALVYKNKQFRYEFV
jgi:FtsZ-binding cell division protein ZapB